MDAVKYIEDFYQLGCKDVNKSSTAYYVQQNLQNTNKYSNFSKAYDAELDFTYLITIQDGKTHVFIPLHKDQQLDMRELSRIEEKLKKLHTECITHLAISEGGSGILSYTVTPEFLDRADLPRKRLKR